MYILLIGRGYPTAKDPQWGTFEKDQALALRDLGHKVVIASVDARFSFSLAEIGKISCYKDNGIVVYNCRSFPGVLLINAKIKVKVRQYFMNKIYKQIIKSHGHPQLIYSHYLLNSALAIPLKKKYNIPIVAIEHWSILNNDILSKYVVYLGNLVYPKVDKVIAVSNSLSKRIQNHFGKESVIVHNMVGEDFVLSTKMRTKTNDKICYVAIGSLIKRKGYDVLISAFERVELEKDCWKLIIIGDGEEKEFLQKQISEAGFSQNIQLVGCKTKQEIANILYESHVFVLSSRIETFGVVYIEAMMTGLPVIGTVCGGPEEFINETNGLLVPVDNIDALVKAIEHMYYHYMDYNSQKIANDCSENFSSSVIARKLTAIFEEVVNNK